MVVKITWRRVLAAAAALGALGLGLAWSGVINIGASTGHAAVTDWFLHWAMRNTVRTYAALTVDEPAADPDHLVAAAGHFAASCAVCHGAPGEQASPVMQSMTPPPPNLVATVSTWTDAQLFWIIKHGVKFTAMPAWPSLERDDEIRRMTAFVRRLPEMSAQQYRALAYGGGAIAGGETSDLTDALADCARCHAENGRGQTDIPIIAGQKAAYLEATLDAYAEGRRESGVMSAAAARTDAPLRRALARHFAAEAGGLTPRPLGAAAPAGGGLAAGAGPAAGDDVAVEGGPAADSEAAIDGEAAADGRAVAARDLAQRAAGVVANGMPERDLPACANCHAPGKREQYPLLAGQKSVYLAARLRLWRDDPLVVDVREEHATMPAIARRIPEELIEPLAAYFAAQ